MGSDDADKSNLPDNTAFTQQRLPASQPTLNLFNVVGTFIVVGVLFIPLGVGLLITSNNIIERTVDYTNCGSCPEVVQASPSNPHPTCSCTVAVTFDEAVKGPLYVYYKLDNFYQNHFQYMRSIDYGQLSGKTKGLGGDSRDWNNLGPFCTPRHDGSAEVMPCGAVANSLFNDTIASISDPSTTTLPIDRSDIAWKTDYTNKFNNPTDDTCAADDLNCAFTKNGAYGQANPSNWQHSIENVNQITGYPSGTSPNANETGYNNQPLEVWLRSGAFSTIYKLYGVIRQDVPASTYTVSVNYNYPVKGLYGDLNIKKSLVFSQMSWAGGKNPFLGIAYIVVGALCLLGGLFLFLVATYPGPFRKLHGFEE